MRVLTFGVQVAEVAVDVGTGEVRVGRIAAIHDVGRIVNPLGARSQVEGGIVQALGHTLSEHRLLDPRTGTVLTQTLDAYKLPTIADVPEIVCEFMDEPDSAPDESRLEGSRRAADHPHRRRDRERDPRRDGRGRPLAPDRPRGDAARARRGETQGTGCSSFGLTRSRKRSQRSEEGAVALGGGTDLVPLLRDGIVEAETLVELRGRRPTGIRTGARSGPEHALADARGRLSGFRPLSGRPAASPPRPSCGRWARSAATSSRRRAAGTGG